MSRLPTLFISHGAPTFALAPGSAGEQLGRLGRQLPEPRAILVVSPHWTTQGIEVMTGLRPPTAHDFGRFPQALYQLRYPVDGHPQLAGAAAQLLAAAGHKVTLNERQGLDHGAWVPLLHLFPKGQAPVFQVSMPADLTAQGALNLGAAATPATAQVLDGGITHGVLAMESYVFSDPPTGTI